jgi:alpha-amylase/alpha-mannosidase (GH57 family)
MAVSFALVHHANQFLITDGYDTREGISDIVGSQSLGTGMLGLFAVHEAEAVPFNFHISGTLLEAISWHCPFAIPLLREYIREGLVELIGSCYGQNIMRFFSPEYNVQQLNEELRLFEMLLGVTPSQVKVFWPPERVWDTKTPKAWLRCFEMRSC